MRPEQAWSNLSDQQRAATDAAATLLDDVGMRFVMLLFSHDGVGAVISNIEPEKSVGLIEQALSAAQANVGAMPIDRAPRH